MRRALPSQENHCQVPKTSRMACGGSPECQRGTRDSTQGRLSRGRHVPGHHCWHHLRTLRFRIQALKFYIGYLLVLGRKEFTTDWRLLCAKVWASLVAQLVKNLPATRETWVLIPWRRERLPTPVFWPGEFHGLYSPWGRKESDTTERLGEEEGMVL